MGSLQNFAYVSSYFHWKSIPLKWDCLISSKLQRSQPSKHFLLSKTSSRRLQDVFSVILFVFQDVFKTYLQYVFLKRLQDVFKTCLQDVFKTSWKTKKCYTEDAFSTSSPRRMFAGKVEKCYSREFSRLHLNGRC